MAISPCMGPPHGVINGVKGKDRSDSGKTEGFHDSVLIQTLTQAPGDGGW